MARLLYRFRRDRRGNVALLFGLSAMMIFSAMGAGLDLSRAYLARQKLSQVATLACQFASRPVVIEPSYASYTGQNGGAAYVTQVNSFITTTWQSQNVNLTQTNAAPFSFVVGGASTVTLNSSVPTTFMSIAGFTAIPIAVQTRCFDSAAAMPPAAGAAGGDGSLLVSDGFEKGGPAPNSGGYGFIRPDGTVGTQTTSTPFTSAIGYTGSSGTQWHITGYCLEQDAAYAVKGTIFEGTTSVELDCDNGMGGAGNSSISTKVSVPAGIYELRYAYASRDVYPDYDPVYLCSSSAKELDWANSTNAYAYGVSSSEFRTNQVNVYFDLNDSSVNAPPVHLTSSSEQLSGKNLIDMCLNAPNWVERSVKLNVTTPGDYWLSFAADGRSDSRGGQIDNIRLCRVICAGTVQDNFVLSTKWTTNQVLFADSFETCPSYTQDYPNHWIYKSGNLNNSLGTSKNRNGSIDNTTPCWAGQTPSGWPGQTPAGWATAPYNQVNYSLNGAAQGSQHILLDGYNQNGAPERNRLVSRPFLLDPGYYQVSYKYISMVDFSSSGGYGTYCAAAPNSGYIFPSYYPPATGVIRYYTTKTTDGSTNIVGAFMSHGQKVSTPITGGAPGSTTSYNNPDGTVSTTPTVPPDTVYWPSYNAAVPNPVIDVCGYAAGYIWQSRDVAVKITKPGNYWLTFSANGSLADGDGGGIDDVKLIALGSLSNGAPSLPVVTIPVPNPQLDVDWHGPPEQPFNGFTIIPQLTP